MFVCLFYVCLFCVFFFVCLFVLCFNMLNHWIPLWQLPQVQKSAKQRQERDFSPQNIIIFTIWNNNNKCEQDPNIMFFSIWNNNNKCEQDQHELCELLLVALMLFSCSRDLLRHCVSWELIENSKSCSCGLYIVAKRAPTRANECNNSILIGLAFDSARPSPLTRWWSTFRWKGYLLGKYMK